MFGLQFHQTVLTNIILLFHQIVETVYTNIVTFNSITCSNVVATRQLHMCTLIVQSIVCENIPGAASNPQTIAIKGYNNIIIELLN